jgi:hypothetical protein
LAHGTGCDGWWCAQAFGKKGHSDPTDTEKEKPVYEALKNTEEGMQGSSSALALSELKGQARLLPNKWLADHPVEPDRTR